MRLRVNPDPLHTLDKKIIASSQLIVESLDNNSLTKDKVMYELLDLEFNIQTLLKQEWDKSKNEAITGKPDSNHKNIIRKFITKT